MTGIRNSNHPLGAAIACVLAAAVPLPGLSDEIFLEGAGHLTGSVHSISDDGSVLLETPLAPAAIPLVGTSVNKVVFSTPAKKPEAATFGVTLANGDVLPGAVESLDGKHLTMVSSIAGRVVIPRDLLQSLQLGVQQPNLIYAGPDGWNGWTRDTASTELWALKDGAFHVSGKGKISRDVEVPPQFIVRFKMTWERNPNIKFYFASPSGTDEQAVDRYYLLFNDKGIQITRESSTGRHFTPLVNIARLPQQYPDKQLTIEIRVDRPGRTLHLFLNDEPENPCKDSATKAPAAGGIGFECAVEGESNVQISKVEVLDWNPKGERRRAEVRGDATKDALIGIKSERFSGSLLEVKKGPEGMLYVFKSSFQENPLEVPESEVSTIFLVGKKPPATDVGKFPCILQLRDGGALHVSSCTVSPDQVLATHPLLGKLTLQRTGVTGMERMSPKPKEIKEP